MRFLQIRDNGELTLTRDFADDPPPYAILSHTWNEDNEQEVTFSDMENKSGTNKAGYAKLQFCGKQAKKDRLEYIWMDTCCINKANLTELSKAITLMFHWYQNAVKCYVYLSDVSAREQDRGGQTESAWESDFWASRWFQRGWTLQELVAPAIVEFFSCEGNQIGDKKSLEKQVHQITQIPITALRGTPLTDFSVNERKRWAAQRKTKEKEDRAYCLLGIFNVFIPLIYGEGDHAFTRLEEEIEKRHGRRSSDAVKPEIGVNSIGSPATPIHVHWLVSRPASSIFTGREDLLQELVSIIHKATESPRKHTQCRIVLSGIGGQGKSETCLQLAQRVRDVFWGVFWVDVSTTGTAERSFLDVAQKLSIPAQTWQNALLGIANLKRPWLLVLDNADNLDVDYQDYFPDGTLGVVILTSRNYECQQYATVKLFALEGLSDKDAQDLLLRVLDVPLDQHSVFAEDAIKVAALLQSHPLALIQAGAYVSRGHCTLAEYPQVFDRERQRLLKFRPSKARSRYGDVYATFEASANVLQASQTEAAVDALQLLPVLAVCGPGRIPLKLFEAGWKGVQSVPSSTTSDDDDDINIALTRWHVSHLLPLMHVDASAWDPFRLIEAIHMLKALSLVSTDTYSGFVSVSMHPLIHAWARDRQEAIEQHQSWVKTGCLVALSEDDGDFWRQHGRQLQPHIQALTAWDINTMFGSEPAMRVTSILLRCGWLLNHMRQDAGVFVLMCSLLNHLGLDRQNVDRRWLEVYQLTGRNLIYHGKIREAVLLLEQVVKIQEQTLVEDHPDRLASQHALAGVYEANGQVTEAVLLLEQVVKIEEQTLAKDHPDRLASQHALALVYKANGQVTEAVLLLEQVVKIREQTLAEDHPDRLASQHALAVVYQVNGQVTEAVLLLEQVVKIWEQTLAEDHPSRLATQHALALVYEANGQVTEAVLLLEQVVKIREQTLAKDHPDRLASQHALAVVYQVNGQVTEAVLLLEQVVKIREQTLVAEDHPDRLASQHVLALVYQANGQVTEAVLLLEQVVKIREQTLAKDHPSRLASRHNLATMYWNVGQRDAALQMMEHVVERRRHVLGKHHPDRISSERWLDHFESEMCNTQHSSQI